MAWDLLQVGTARIARVRMWLDHARLDGAVVVLRQKIRYSCQMNYRERISIDPRVRSGKPCIRGTRITVSDVFDYLGGGMTVDEILDDFPDLTEADILACVAFRREREAFCSRLTAD